MIDFTGCPVNKFKGYGGANGNKINIMYDDTSYMLKFPPVSGKNKAMSYTNSCVSEYLSCHIFESLGFEVQQTLLGTYKDRHGKEKTVVACRDFTADGKKLMEFFWDMFIADAFLGNFDRHNGNWGILVDEQKQSAEIAPVYDCGSCLYPQMDVGLMQTVLSDENEINQRIYAFPTSAVLEDGRKIGYFNYISSLKNEDCNRALARISGCIDMDKIDRLVDETPGITELQKDFYKIMLSERKIKILDYSMALLQEQRVMQKQDLSM